MGTKFVITGTGQRIILQIVLPISSNALFIEYELLHIYQSILVSAEGGLQLLLLKSVAMFLDHAR